LNPARHCSSKEILTMTSQSTTRLLLGAATTVLLALQASTAQAQGWYVGLEGGGNWIDDTDVSVSFNNNTPTTGTFEFESGWAAFATAGYAFGGFRVELEGGYRANDLVSSTGDLTEWTVMANALYDIPVSDKLKLSVGGGAGADFATLDIPGTRFNDNQWNFAWQGIAGLSYALSKHLDLTLTYRYLRVTSPDFAGIGYDGEGVASLSYGLDDIVKHAATVGLRYSFGAEEAPPPPPPEAPAAAPPPAPEAPREFIVFFGFNQSNLTDEALGVVQQAAEAAKTYGSASIALVGHADRSGSNAYNNALSLKRAGSVKAALVKDGIADTAISTLGKGEEDPLVPTADGVREPQNRRVQISLQ
jgi:outer membrane protein OmpA-like peptidoglycan-associated protein